MQADKYSI